MTELGLAGTGGADEHGTRTGGCLCGAVRYVASGKLTDVVDCHCGQCRRWHGHVGAYANLPTSALRIGAADALAWFRSSPFARRGFCRTCGSSLFWQRDGVDHISIAAGTIDGLTGLSTARHIYVDDKGDYYRLDDGVPQRGQGS